MVDKLEETKEEYCKRFIEEKQDAVSICRHCGGDVVYDREFNEHSKKGEQWGYRTPKKLICSKCGVSWSRDNPYMHL